MFSMHPRQVGRETRYILQGRPVLEAREKLRVMLEAVLRPHKKLWPSPRDIRVAYPSWQGHARYIVR